MAGMIDGLLYDRLEESTAILMVLRSKLNNMVRPKIIDDITAVIDKNDAALESSTPTLSAIEPTEAMVEAAMRDLTAVTDECYLANYPDEVRDHVRAVLSAALAAMKE